jgi:hypothetical protein
MSYDSKCYDLAEHFIGSAPELERLRRALAQHIQTSIEDWLMYEEPDAPLVPKQ